MSGGPTHVRRYQGGGGGPHLIEGTGHVDEAVDVRRPL
jgi:hypothetical protein